MPRRLPMILGFISVVGVAALAYQSSHRKPQSNDSAPPIAASAPAGSVAAVVVPTVKESSASPTDTAATDASGFHLMPDGSSVPPLKDSDPDRVKLGVVLFRYKGAQGASESTRSKVQAVALAKKAIETGKEDFAAAVRQGDRGSSENIGWIGHRILERSVEYAVFSLDKGNVSSEPVDTPRGIWVVKRLR
jgi:hypothetical protein